MFNVCPTSVPSGSKSSPLLVFPRQSHPLSLHHISKPLQFLLPNPASPIDCHSVSCHFISTLVAQKQTRRPSCLLAQVSRPRVIAAPNSLACSLLAVSLSCYCLPIMITEHNRPTSRRASYPSASLRERLTILRPSLPQINHRTRPRTPSPKLLSGASHRRGICWSPH